MSVIAVKITPHTICIGADSIIVRGGTQEKKHLKLFSINQFTIGVVGSAQNAGLLRLFCGTHSPKASCEESVLEFISEFQSWLKLKTGEDSIDDLECILVFEGNAFYIQSFFVSKILKYQAIGAGETFALSALYLGKTVKQALLAACHLSVYCEAPIKTLFFRRKK